MSDILAILCGGVVGLSLGLTGGGGSIFAVPLLIYVLQVDVRESVGISLITVGASSCLGAIMHIIKGNIEWKPTLLLALTGMLGAPAGTILGKQTAEHIKLSLFALIMLIVGVKMFLPRKKTSREGSYCFRNREGAIQWSSKCAGALALLGVVVGILSGFFGVGGGFLIVPALVLVGGMKPARAVASSLLIIMLICSSALMSYIVSGQSFPEKVTALFIVGGILGMVLSSQLVKKVNDGQMQKLFAFSMWGIALFMLLQNWLMPHLH